ncbi:mammalian cell entry protein [Mycolicibacterium sp.]|uniref:mammalian cell entry protein n=1 Tax=Mycolicibacterium sp. TaxID=2320850 RepID=UPI0037C928D7
MTEETASTVRPERRRASRAAGPAGGEATPTTTDIRIEAAPPAKPAAKTPKKPAATPLKLVRRRPHAAMVALVATAVLGVVVIALASLVALMAHEQGQADAAQARDQRFVDTGKQTVVNMFSYTQDTIDESVRRFVDDTSGPLRDMMTRDNNADNLKALFRDTNASSEAVVSGAALEGIDDIAGNASVLVAVRVTVTDVDGVNAPSKPYRLRVIVHEDDNGHMTGYDIKWPDGGN